MSFKKFNEVAELLGMVAIVASLIFVGLQLRQSQRIALAEIEAANSSASIELASLLSDHSEAWVRGIAGEELEDSDAEVFKSIVITLADIAYSQQEQFRLLGDYELADAVVHELDCLVPFMGVLALFPPHSVSDRIIRPQTLMRGSFYCFHIQTVSKHFSRKNVTLVIGYPSNQKTSYPSNQKTI